MNVRELIAELKKQPPELEVRVWDHDEDDNVPIVQVLYEDGTSHIQLLTHPEKVIPVHAFGSCGGVCAACGDE